ncbi:peptidyl-prolyl cis-trans isomerase [Pricia sp. S334]|uniref:Peptidyl-prolyl cis-trans isomerase n=1 Tax=Pricia mediterranea TaxID=3076079 RepID=A0ABU3L9H7_9FLAO|nr:peptidyl-prolyl cis-trans isomerase [Pricia sp. S334]MDT7829854.1 peptidyl-prolyl cis-trans isomerase [Pricia sp. S334]
MRAKVPSRIYVLCCLVATVLLGGCDSLWKKERPEALARVGDNYLFKEDLAPLFGNSLSKDDSIAFVTDYINTWASNQLLLDKAKINLPEDKLKQFEALVADYRTDLYTRAYKEALVQQVNDSTVNESELQDFYEREKENFRLKEKLVKLRFVALSKDFLNKVEVAERLKNFGEKDQNVLDSISVQFRKASFNDSIWVTASRIIDEIPPLTFENVEKHLKKSQFLNMEDDSGVYLAKIIDVMEVDDIAPLSFIEPTIERVLLSRRKLDFIRKLETDVIDEAIQKRKFEVYDKTNKNSNDEG